MSREFAGRYTIERELGRGATSVVYLAHDEDGRAVAIKVLREELITQLNTERFLREVRVTAKLDHPNIVPVLDSGESEGRPYFVLKHLSGGTLRARLEREKQLSIPDVIAMGTMIASALQFAHERNLLHRDVKPENILFAEGQACLADFGIARALSQSSGESTTSTGVVRGTPAYMSPEQAAGDRDIDARSDIYSLACVLYEALAGVPAFVGPTSQSVVAQRLSHTPRGVRMYRPTAPVALEAVLERALALSPADRFQTAAELKAALSEIDVTSRGATLTPANRVPSRRNLLLAGGVIVAVGAVVMLIEPRVVSHAPAVPLDTTMLAVLTLDGGDSARASESRELLQEALGRWRGITIVDRYQVADAYRRRGGVRTTDDAAALAASLGAGRYVRGRVSRTASGSHASVSLFDATSTRELNHAARDIPDDLTGARLAYAQLSKSLLLRGSSADSISDLSNESSVLPAMQAFARAQHALDEWNLAGADSALERAIGYDPEYAGASLWLAQVRAWRDLPPAQWGTIAERAIATPSGLSERERSLGRALVALSRAQYQVACDTYDALRRRNDADFAAWFGLGQCRTMDKIVVPDSSSPSGWRFRSNYRLALAAYTKAFEILPSVHRGYERGAFERLRVLLLTSRSVRPGYGVSDSAMFFARPAWLHDALALVPSPWQQVFAGDPRAIPPGFEEAIRHQRSEFRKIVAGWSAAFPRSADAKYAVALSLELLGDRAAIDTIRLARALTTDDSKRLRFAASEALLLLKFGSPDHLDDLRASRMLADSLLRTSAKLSGADRFALSPVAALAGRCDESDRAARAVMPVAGSLRLPPLLLLEARALVVRVALGCDPEKTAVDLRSLAASISREYGRGDPQTLRRVDEMFLSRPALLAEIADSTILARLATAKGSGRLEAAAAVSRHDDAAARAQLARLAMSSQPALEGPTPDFLLPEARLWLRLGDTATAVRRIDLTLTNASAFDPEDFVEPANVGAFIRAMALRADLAFAAGDQASARRWAEAVVALWANADPDLQPVVKRMSRYAGIH